MPTEVRVKRNRERRDRTRQELLEAAARVFARNGYHRPLVSDIVAEAGVGQGTFYRHFKGKREIFEALLEGFIAELFAEFSEMSAHLPESAREYRDASLAAIRRAAAIAERSRDICLLLIREAPAVDEEIAGIVSGIYDRFARLAQSYLDHAIARGFARPFRSDVIAQAIVGIGLRTVEAWLGGRYKDLPFEEVIRELVDFAFWGIGAGGSKSGKERGSLEPRKQ
ncbi:MAG: TetR/AcrR family transcriptional regulator [bacterium]